MEGIKNATIDELKAKKREKEELRELLVERAKWARIEKEAKEQKDACTQALLPLFQKFNIKSVFGLDDNGVSKLFTAVESANVTISKQALLSKGIDPGIIAECTVRTPYVMIQVKDVEG